MSQNAQTGTIERFPSFTFEPEQLAPIHTTRRQLGKADDVTNSVLVLASRIAKANAVKNRNQAKQVERQLVKYLNNNATWRIVNSDDSAQYGFGDQTSVLHNLASGRIVRAK